MAFVEHKRAQVWWNALGKGEPVVLLMGLGCSSAMWFRLVPHLISHRRVILIDNRGAGQTQARWSLAHRVSVMAQDVAAVLDAAGEPQAHVVGFSMGGMIAQQFALDFPARVRSLLLMATNCGSQHSMLAEQHVIDLLFSKGGMTPEEALRAMRPYTYAAATSEELIEQDTQMRLATYPGKRDYDAQLYGLLYWSSYARLPELRCPTLVLHGDEDLLIPPANGYMLANRIPGAEFLGLPDASHWMLTDQTARIASAVDAFTHEHRAATRT